METSELHNDQRGIADWFDGTYRRQGFGYLRPLAAYPIFLQLLEAQPGEELLDVACGPGLLLKAGVMRQLRVTGIDISAEAIRLAQDFVPSADVRVGNAEALPFADASFDLLTCIGSLERMIDREQVLAEMCRVLRPGGRLCLMLRNAKAPGWRLWRQALRRQNHAGHQDAKGLEEWQALLESAGFTLRRVEIDQWGRQKLRRLLRLGRAWNFARPEPVAKAWFSKRLAYEYIFILQR